MTLHEIRSRLFSDIDSTLLFLSVICLAFCNLQTPQAF